MTNLIKHERFIMRRKSRVDDYIGSKTMTSDLGICRAAPITEARTRSAILALRNSPRFQFVQPADQIRPADVMWRADEIMSPVDIYMILTMQVPDPRIRLRIDRLLNEAAAAILNRRDSSEAAGWIYIFHDIADPPDVLKIGRTTALPEQRLAEWEKELAPEPGRSLTLLSAYRTVANRLAERVLQELFTCEHIEKRVNPVTGRRLTEFYQIDNLMTTKLIVREVLRSVNSFVTYWRRRRPRQDN
jgi:hypothetical protein